MVRRLLVASLLIPGVATASPSLDEEEVEFVRLINAYRAEQGLPCLSVSPTANVAADYMSRAMGEQGFFSHNEPPCEMTEEGEVCTGRDPFERLIDSGHEGWRLAGENIFAGSLLAADAFRAWRNSPGHDANMRGPHFTAMGLARVEVPGSEMGVYWTNVFSDLVDGSHDCNQGLPPVGYGGEGFEDPEEEPCVPPENELDPDGGWGIGLPGTGNECGPADEETRDDRKGGGCATAAGSPALVGLLALAALLPRWRRR